MACWVDKGNTLNSGRGCGARAAIHTLDSCSSIKREVDTRSFSFIISSSISGVRSLQEKPMLKPFVRFVYSDIVQVYERTPPEDSFART